jgi:TPR repeat protein
MVMIRSEILACLLVAGMPATAQQEAHPNQEDVFTELKPGDTSVDPDNLITGANMGDVRAINNLGLLWARGVGTEGPNFPEAMRFWKEAAKRGYTLSMNNLGLLYANGNGVKQSYEEAMKWWEMSAERGDAWAMNSIGDLYENGHGVAQSYAQALGWYERAAQAGDRLAMYNLGHFYEEGLGVQANGKAAMDWYERSADKGTGVAMYRLGRMLQAGAGVPADPAEAHAWMTVANQYFTGEDGPEASANKAAVAELQTRLTAQQLERSREIARNLHARIEERRKQKPFGAGPGERET